MKLPFGIVLNDEDRKLPRLGRISPIDIEVSDAVSGWYYFGRVEMWEKEYKFADREEKSKLFFYRLLTDFREDEKLVVTDQDFIHDADQIPYTQTRKGRNRMFSVIMVAFGMVYALTLYLMALFIQAGPSIVYYTQQVAGLEWDVGNIAFIFISGALIWAWAARYHHYVSDWEIQPLRYDSVKVSTDFYILVNSSKVPVFEKTLELARLDRPAIDSMVAAARAFPKEELDKVQGLLKAARMDLTHTEIQATAQHFDKTEIGLLAQKYKLRERPDMIRTAFLVGVVGIVGLIIGIIASGV